MTKEIINFNKDQIQHQQYVLNLILDFFEPILREAIRHDESKWFDNEYQTFVESRNSLRGSTNGKDDNYQKSLKSEAIQHHINENKHHPEYWDKRKMKMPIDQIIIMFFDWLSRSIARGTELDDFWDYNISKLINQKHAITIVEALKEHYEITNPLVWKKLI